MTDLLEKALREVGKLAPEEQDEVAGVMLEMIEQRQHRSVLTEEQQAELRRRLADPNPVLVSMESAFARLDRLWQDRRKYTSTTTRSVISKISICRLPASA